MEKEIIVLSSSNVVLEPIESDDTASLSTVSVKIENKSDTLTKINGVTNGQGETKTGVDHSLSNGNGNSNSDPPTKANNTPRNSKGFNACKTEWVRLNIGKAKLNIAHRIQNIF